MRQNPSMIYEDMIDHLIERTEADFDNCITNQLTGMGDTVDLPATDLMLIASAGVQLEHYITALSLIKAALATKKDEAPEPRKHELADYDQIVSYHKICMLLREMGVKEKEFPQMDFEIEPRAKVERTLIKLYRMKSNIEDMNMREAEG